MKKLILAALLTVAGVASAADVGVSYAYDYNVEKSGLRVSTNVYGVDLNATHVNDTYNRFAVGKEFPVYKLGRATLSVGATGVYQRTLVGGFDNGYGVTGVARVSYPLAKNLTATAAIEEFWGQSRLSKFEGAVGTIGISYKF